MFDWMKNLCICKQFYVFVLQLKYKIRSLTFVSLNIEWNLVHENGQSFCTGMVERQNL